MTNPPDKPEYIDEPLGEYLLRLVKTIAWVFGGFFAVAFAAVLIGEGYDQLDLNGDISHDRTLDVYMSSNWLVGENRICYLSAVQDAEGKPTAQLSGLQCPVGDEKLEPHNLTVTFKGIVSPKGMNDNARSLPDQWKCTRGSDSFTCVAVAKP